MTENTEAQIQADIIKYLELNRFIVFRLNSGRARHNIRLCPNGTPDLLAISCHGSVWWIEVKKPDGKVSTDQWEMINDLKARGQNVIVAYSVMDVQTAIR